MGRAAPWSRLILATASRRSLAITLILAYKGGIMPYKTYKFDAEVLQGGKVELTTPLPSAAASRCW